MTAPIPEEAVTAAAALIYHYAGPLMWESVEDGDYTTFKKWEDVQYKDQWFAKARAVLAAAEKPWREHIAQEIERGILPHVAFGMNFAARIVREGGTQ